MTEESSELTREQADQALHKAITEHARAYGLAEPEDMLGDFALVSHWVSMDSATTSGHYLTQFQSEQVPDHIALGLFHIGIDIINSEEDD